MSTYPANLRPDIALTNVLDRVMRIPTDSVMASQCQA